MGGVGEFSSPLSTSERLDLFSNYILACVDEIMLITGTHLVRLKNWQDQQPDAFLIYLIHNWELHNL